MVKRVLCRHCHNACDTLYFISQLFPGFLQHYQRQSLCHTSLNSCCAFDSITGGQSPRGRIHVARQSVRRYLDLKRFPVKACFFPHPIRYALRCLWKWSFCCSHFSLSLPTSMRILALLAQMCLSGQGVFNCTQNSTRLPEFFVRGSPGVSLIGGCVCAKCLLEIMLFDAFRASALLPTFHVRPCPGMFPSLVQKCPLLQGTV